MDAPLPRRPLKGPVTAGRHRGGARPKRRIATPVRTGLLGASAAMAVGAVAVASGLLPGGGQFSVGAGGPTGEQVRTEQPARRSRVRGRHIGDADRPGLAVPGRSSAPTPPSAAPVTPRHRPRTNRRSPPPGPRHDQGSAGLADAEDHPEDRRPRRARPRCPQQTTTERAVQASGARESPPRRRSSLWSTRSGPRSGCSPLRGRPVAGPTGAVLQRRHGGARLLRPHGPGRQHTLGPCRQGRRQEARRREHSPRPGRRRRR